MNAYNYNNVQNCRDGVFYTIIFGLGFVGFFLGNLFPPFIGPILSVVLGFSVGTIISFAPVSPSCRFWKE